MRYEKQFIGGLLAAAFAIPVAYQLGYDTARAECKPLPSYEIKPMSHKQQVRAAKWHMRDKGWIK